MSTLSMEVRHRQIVRQFFTSLLENCWILFSAKDENKNRHVRDVEQTGLAVCFLLVSYLV
jgi:hypothetical protein